MSKDDPRVAPPPTRMQLEMEDLLKQFTMNGPASSTERDDMRYGKILLQRREREIREIERMRAEEIQARLLARLAEENRPEWQQAKAEEIQRAMRNVSNQGMGVGWGQQNAAQNVQAQMGQGVAAGGVMGMAGMAAGLNPFLQHHGGNNITQPASLDAEGDTERQAFDHAIMNMNQIARAKYEPLFKLLEIKVRFTATAFGTAKQWIIAKKGKDGRWIRQEWSSPQSDPACSLNTWSAMVAELMDEVARREGIDVPANYNPADYPGAGQQVAAGAGNS